MAVRSLWWAACGSLLVIFSPARAQTWVSVPGTEGEWASIASSADGSKLVASQFPGAIYTSTNFGALWISNNTPNLDWKGVASSADGSMLAAAAAGDYLYTFTSSGGTWMTNNVPLANWNCVAVSADGNTLAAGINQNTPEAIYLSTNSGATWSPSSAPATNGCFAITLSANGEKIAAIVNEGGFCTSTDGGNTWAMQTNAPNQLNVSLASSADGNKLMMGAGQPGGFTGYVYVSTNAGTNWTQTQLQAGYWQALASSADGTKLIAADVDGSIYNSSDSGNTWVTNFLAMARWSGITSSADGNRLALCLNPGPIATEVTTPSPRLNVVSCGKGMRLSWVIPSTNFVLQQNFDLTTTLWSDITNAPILNPTNLEDEVVLPSSNSYGFYRLEMQ